MFSLFIFLALFCIVFHLEKKTEFERPFTVWRFLLGFFFVLLS